MSDRPRRGVVELRGVEHRPLDAQPHITAPGRDHAAKARAEPAGHARLQRELGGNVVPGAQPADRFQHSRRAAGVDLDRGTAGQLCLQQVGHQALMAHAAVIGGQAGPAEQQRALGMRGVAESKQCSRVQSQLVLPDRQWRDPHPAADQQRTPLITRGGEANAEWPDQPQILSGLQLTQPPGPRPHVLDQELQLAPRARRAHDAERAGQKRPLVLPRPPARPGAEHVELAGLRPWSNAVGDPQDHVGAVLLTGGNAGSPAAERGGHAGRTHRTSLRWSLCGETTSGTPRGAEAIARAAAIPPAIVVMHGTPLAIAAERISYPSVRAPVPTGVLITRSTSPRSIQSTTCGEPSPILLMSRAGIPIRRNACAVPRVATMAKPRSCSMVAIPVAAGLSPSATVMNTVPRSGSRNPAAACALANAVGKSRAMPITSPVERISGPSSESAPAKRSNGSTASSTHTCPLVGSAGRRKPARRSPSRIRQASLASGSPIALDTNGTVRDARGLASITCSPSSPWIADCTLCSPTTPTARAIP